MSPVPSAGWEVAQVVRVIDGDTIEVTLNGQRKTVRYVLVNTPETAVRDALSSATGKASNANKGMVEGKTVYLEKDT